MRQHTSTTAIAPRWVPAGALDVLLHNQAASHGGLLSTEARAAIKEALEQAKSRGNQSYAAQRYDEALVFYQQAQRADPRNTTQMLHAVLSNMSAVHATQGNWRKSFHHVRARARSVVVCRIPLAIIIERLACVLAGECRLLKLCSSSRITPRGTHAWQQP